MSFTSTRETLDRAAEVLWKVAGDDNQQVSRYDTPAYEHASELVEALYYQAFADADSESWEYVRTRLAELGPHDSDAASDVPGLHGIASYHAAATAERAAGMLEDAKEAFRESFRAIVREAVEEYHDAGKGRPAWDRAQYEDFRSSLEDITRDVLFSR